MVASQNHLFYSVWVAFEFQQNGGVSQRLVLQCLRSIQVVAKWRRLENTHFIVFQPRGKTVVSRNHLFYSVWVTFEICQNGGVSKPLILQCLRSIQVVEKWWCLENVHFAVFHSRQSSCKMVASRNHLFYSVWVAFEIWQNGGVSKPLVLRCLRGIQVVGVSKTLKVQCILQCCNV